MLRILGKSNSINVRKILWLCSELSLDYELEEWGREESDLNKPEFLELNPNGLVPVIVDNDFVLWESNSICRYLASSEKRLDLLPQEPRTKASVEKWMDWQATELNNSWRYSFMSLVRKDSAYSDLTMINSSAEAWNKNMELLNSQLNKSGMFVVGVDFTLADIVLGLATHRWLSTPIERPNLPAVQAYYQQLCQRDGFIQHGCNGIP